MRNSIIAIAAASILFPTLALAADGNTETAVSMERPVYEASYDRDHDGKEGRDEGKGRKACQINYQGPVDLTPLAELKGFQWGEEKVIVEGRIIRQLANGDFILSDGKDEVVVELDDIRLNNSVDENTTLRLYGEYEGWDKKLEAEHIQIVK